MTIFFGFGRLLFVSGWVVFCWCWAAVLNVFGVVVTSCVNGASPVGFVLSFYLCAFQIKPVCVVCLVTSY